VALQVFVEDGAGQGGEVAGAAGGDVGQDAGVEVGGDGDLAWSPVRIAS
jgi:hypothetical protein